MTETSPASNYISLIQWCADTLERAGWHVTPPAPNVLGLKVKCNACGKSWEQVASIPVKDCECGAMAGKAQVTAQPADAPMPNPNPTVEPPVEVAPVEEGRVELPAPSPAGGYLTDAQAVTCVECGEPGTKQTTVKDDRHPGGDGKYRHGVCHRARYMGLLPDPEALCVVCQHPWSHHDYRTKVCAQCGMGKKGEGCQAFVLAGSSDDDRLLCRECWGDLPLPGPEMQPECEAKCHACGTKTTLMRVNTVLASQQAPEAPLIEPTPEQKRIVHALANEAAARNDPALDGF